MVVRLKNSKQKSKIFGNISKLKGVKCDTKGYYRIEDQLPEEISERGKHMNMHFRDAKKTQQADRFKLKRGMLTIDDVPYKQEIVAPRPTDLLFAPEQMIRRSNQLVIHEGKEIIERGSRFIGYITEVQDQNDVRAAYYKMR